MKLDKANQAAATASSEAPQDKRAFSGGAAHEVFDVADVVEKIVAKLDLPAVAATRLVDKTFHSASAVPATWRALAQAKRPNANPVPENTSMPDLQRLVFKNARVDSALAGKEGFGPVVRTLDAHEHLEWAFTALTQGYHEATLTPQAGETGAWQPPKRGTEHPLTVDAGKATLEVSGERLVAFKTKCKAHAMALLSPDRSHCLLYDDVTLEVHNVTGPEGLLKQTVVMPPSDMPRKFDRIEQAAWFADGKRFGLHVNFASDHSRVEIHDRTQPLELPLILSPRRGLSKLVDTMLIAPHGNQVALLMQGGVIASYRCDSRSAAPVVWLRSQEAASVPQTHVSWSPDGQYLALARPGAAPVVARPAPAPADPDSPVASPFASPFMPPGFDEAFKPQAPLPAVVEIWAMGGVRTGSKLPSIEVPRVSSNSYLGFSGDGSKIYLQDLEGTIEIDLLGDKR